MKSALVQSYTLWGESVESSLNSWTKCLSLCLWTPVKWVCRRNADTFSLKKRTKPAFSADANEYKPVQYMCQYQERKTSHVFAKSLRLEQVMKWINTVQRWAVHLLNKERCCKVKRMANKTKHKWPPCDAQIRPRSTNERSEKNWNTLVQKKVWSWRSQRWDWNLEARDKFQAWPSVKCHWCSKAQRVKQDVVVMH